jgi:hypothetical protein
MTGGSVFFMGCENGGISCDAHALGGPGAGTRYTAIVMKAEKCHRSEISEIEQNG